MEHLKYFKESVVIPPEYDIDSGELEDILLGLDGDIIESNIQFAGQKAWKKLSVNFIPKTVFNWMEIKHVIGHLDNFMDERGYKVIKATADYLDTDDFKNMDEDTIMMGKRRITRSYSPKTK
jgi:hypothetical protein